MHADFIKMRELVNSFSINTCDQFSFDSVSNSFSSGIQSFNNHITALRDKLINEKKQKEEELKKA